MLKAMAASRAPPRRTGRSAALLLMALAIAVLFQANGVRADCYWADGTENDRHQPCYAPNGGAIGLCCGSGDVCLSNGICMVGSGRSGRSADSDAVAVAGRADEGVYYRGSCTFRDWSRGKNCPTVCIKGSGISKHNDVGMIPCPGSDTDWYCADSNMKKANCSSGAFIVSLPKPVSFTTIGVTPTPSTTSAASASLSSADATTTASVAVPVNTTSSALPTGPSDGTGTAPPAATTTVTGAAPPGTPSPSPSETPSSSSSAAVPLAVGVSIGGASLIIAGILAFLIWRRRQRHAPARAESPPPRSTPDDGLINPVLSGPLFRSGSLLRRTSNGDLTKGAAAGPSIRAGAPEAASGFGANGPETFRAGSILSSLSQHGHPHERFSPDSVAMHDMTRTRPSAGWELQGGRNEPHDVPDAVPGIPYDGRRLPPYHGAPLVEHDGYSELPG